MPCVFSPLTARFAVPFALHGVNLVTQQREPPPPGHWKAAWQSIDFTPEQQQQVRAALAFTSPRLEELEHEQLLLLQQVAEVQQPAAGGATGVAGLPSSTADQKIWRHQTAAGRAAAITAATLPDAALQQTTAAAAVRDGGQCAAAVAAAATSSAGSGSSGSSSNGSCSTGNRERQQLHWRAQELAKQLQGSCAKWVTIVNTRAQYAVLVMTPLQAARLVVAAVPYLLIGAPV